MSKIKIKQIDSSGQPEGAVVRSNGDGTNSWVVPETASGSSTYLGVAEDGSYTEPRYEGGKNPAVGLTETTLVSSAIDSINEVLGLLMPDSPDPLSSATLTLSTTNSSQLAASGYTANDLSNAPSAGSAVTRITSSSATTNTIQDVGDGSTGTISLYEQDVLASGETFTFTDATGDAKTTGVLLITDNKWGGTQNGNPAPDGFFQTFDATISAAPAVVGLNRLQLSHTISGTTNVLSFIRDDLTSTPVVSNVSASENTKTGAFSSGVEHYAAGSTLSVSGDTTNLAGQTYVSGTILTLSGPGTSINYAAGQAGLPSILAVNTLSYSMPSQTFTVGGNNKTRTGKITLTAKNPNGTGSNTSSDNLLILSGTGSIADTSITGPATTNRVYLTSGTSDTPSSLAYSAWDSTQDLTASGYSHEAAIVGGVLRCDQTDYSTGYLPASNPNYSGKDASQYVVYRFALAGKSSINVAITGNYAGMWVALPGVSDNATISPNALGGAWWDAKVLYNGAGVPGRSGDTTAGCANGAVATGSSGTTSITFGTESSSNSTGNAVFVRVKLTAGQQITAISIS